MTRKTPINIYSKLRAKKEFSENIKKRSGK